VRAQQKEYDNDEEPSKKEICLEEDVDEDEKGSTNTYRWIWVALKELKNNKAEGNDGIPAELLKALGESERWALSETGIIWDM